METNTKEKEEESNKKWVIKKNFNTRIITKQKTNE